MQEAGDSLLRFAGLLPSGHRRERRFRLPVAPVESMAMAGDSVKAVEKRCSRVLEKLKNRLFPVVY